MRVVNVPDDTDPLIWPNADEAEAELLAKGYVYNRHRNEWRQGTGRCAWVVDVPGRGVTIREHILK